MRRMRNTACRPGVKHALETRNIDRPSAFRFAPRSGAHRAPEAARLRHGSRLAVLAGMACPTSNLPAQRRPLPWPSVGDMVGQGRDPRLGARGESWASPPVVVARRRRTRTAGAPTSKESTARLTTSVEPSRESTWPLSMGAARTSVVPPLFGGRIFSP